MEEEENNQYTPIVEEAFSHELKKFEPPTLMQYLRSLRNNQYRKDELNRLFGQGPIIRDPRTNEAYTNPLALIGDTLDTVNDQVTLKNISPVLQFLPEDNTPSKLKDVMEYSLKDAQYDAMDFVGEKARENIDTGLPILDKVLIGGAVLGTAYAVPDATDFIAPGAADTIRAARKVDWNKLIDWTQESGNSLFNRLTNPNWRAITNEGVEVPNTFFKSVSEGSGGTKFIHSVYPKRNRGLYKQLDKQGLLDQAEKIVQDLDAFKSTKGKIQNYAKWSPDRPTTGFKGNRTIKYTDSAGNPSEVAFRWSVTKNTYVPYDLVKRQNTILKRMRWNVNRSPKAKWYSDRVYSIAKQDNATLKKLLRELRAEDPQRFFDIMGDTRHYATNKGFIFVEHIHAQNSPYWKYVKNQKFKPRDTSNLMIVKNEEFGKLKTAIEGEIYNNKNFKFPEGKRLLLDYDKKRDVLVLKQLQDTGRLKWIGDISPITNPSNWRRALNAALRGHKIEPGKMGEIQQVIQAETDIPKHVDMIDKITDWKKNPYE